MIKRFLPLSALLVGLLLFSCQEKENPQLKEAAAIHNEAHEIMESIEPEVKSLDSLQSALANKQIAAKDTAAFASAVAALDKVQTDFKAWEENLVTVPGMEHEHEHEHEGHGEGEHHHHHEHKKAPDVTPEQHVEIQKEIKKSIEQIQIELKAAKTQAEALLK
ncbi:hypothetical protein [Siphonobacter sp.]|uniref:hypothetical protein n=1 Tax=Siphonobacter sp. TaxID=1869184 RepID=UPI003B3A42FC